MLKKHLVGKHYLFLYNVCTSKSKRVLYNKLKTVRTLIVFLANDTRKYIMRVERSNTLDESKNISCLNNRKRL